MSTYRILPANIGNLKGSVQLTEIAGTTDQLENVQSVQGQPYSLMRAWQPSTLSYVTLSVDASGNLNTAGSGQGGGAVTVADGADVAQGSTTDAAVVSDVNGTVSGKLRGLVKILADIWDSVNHRIKVDGSGVTQPVSGTVTSDQGVANATPWNENVAQVGGVAVTAGVKGTQQTNAVPTQDMKDAGRTYVILYVDRIAGVTTEALVTMTINKNGTTTTGSAYTVTAGKTLRIQSFQAEILDTTTVANRVLARLRVNPSGAPTASSPVLAGVMAAAPAALAATGGVEDVTIPDGLEIPGGQQVGISQLCTVTTAAIVSIFAIGYEY